MYKSNWFSGMPFSCKWCIDVLSTDNDVPEEPEEINTTYYIYNCKYQNAAIQTQCSLCFIKLTGFLTMNFQIVHDYYILRKNMASVYFFIQLYFIARV